jgi:hypothetical protein
LLALVADIRPELHRYCTRMTGSASPAPRPHSAALARYVRLFNARDWDAVRALLADEVRLDLVSREKRAGIAEVGAYLTNYARLSDWHLRPAWLPTGDGVREVVAVRRAADAPRPSYLVELTFVDGRVTLIRDFRYVPYLAQDGLGCWET